MAEGAILKSSAGSDLGAAAVTQLRVIGALTLREMRTRFGRTSLGYVWALLNPALHIAFLAALFTALGRAVPYGESFALFLATGYLPYKLFSTLASRTLGAISGNTAMFTLPIVKPIDAVFARVVLEVATSLSICFVVFGTLCALGLASPPKYPLETAAGFAALALLGMGLGTVNAVTARFLPSWDRMFSLVTTPLYFVSGIFFVPDLMPPQILEILVWNPVLHGVEWFRAGFYADYGGQTLDRGYLLAWGIALLLVGLAAERALRAKGRDR